MFHLKAIEIISKSLRSAVNNEQEGRDGMALGQYIAGMGFSNVGLGIVHSMAHALGAVYDTPHGVANAILLPTVMAYNADATGTKYKDIAIAMGVEGVEDMTQEEYRKAAVDAVKKLSADVGIPADLKEIVKYFRERGMMPSRENKDDSILSLRKILQISNLVNLNEIIPGGAFRMSGNLSVNRNVLGAWIRLCQILENNQNVSTKFEVEHINELIGKIKNVMCQKNVDFQNHLKTVLGEYGIDFSVVKNFRGAPVQGYIFRRSDGVYQMVLTIRGAFADIFWFSLFHELGHIVNGDIGKSIKFIDDGSDVDKETAADLFARDRLLSPESYASFIQKGDFTFEAICSYARTQNVMPYIVIGRLQKEKYLDYHQYSNYKLRYKWGDCS